ncbi:DUF1501 domain-containing protein [Pseudoxanthobacter sp. M-2]|uniref:DUF1501 domain-containing protein n=1 Tax=Pseudoxanthobacter sp. M-2 TaxID=3078754 RepID=UPI0038FCFB70
MRDPNDLRRAAAEGCAESRLLITRRAMLGVTAGLFSAAYLPRDAMAADGDARLLVVVLRGGTDGLSVVVPTGDRDYARLRGDIAIPTSATIKLDSDFGLHPAMKTFGKLFGRNEAAVVHATCVPLRNRSHFDCQDNLENGLPGVGAVNSTGWLNRLLSALPSGDPVVKRGAIQVGEAPLILRGPAPVLGWSPTWFTPAGRDIRRPLLSVYEEVDRPLYSALTRGIEANNLALKADASDDADVSALRKGFRGAGHLLAEANGPRIAVLSVGNWDTHSGQGGTEGFLADRLAELDEAIADFRKAVGSAWKKTVVICATEFGRTARVNGDGGTDHGVGTVALLAGGAVAGGKVYGDWPGLAPSKLFEDSDLRATTDLRAVFKGVLRGHLDVPAGMLDKSIFPESAKIAPLTTLVAGGDRERVSSAADTGRPVRQRPLPPIARYRAKQAGASL